MNQRIRQRLPAWVLAVVLALVFSIFGKACSKEEVIREQITVNAPQAMHEAFEVTLRALKLEDKYEIKFTNSENANFTVTTQKSNSNEMIAYSPVVAVFNEDEELFENLIKNKIFVKSETESDKYDFDLKTVMLDIIKNPNSLYKVYYPDETICDWSVFYAFLLYSANDGCYPSEGTNMIETREIVDAFLESKRTEAFSRDSIDKIGGFAKNTIYLMPLADVGYIYQTKLMKCRVMYPKTVVYSNYYVCYDEIGKVLYDLLDDTGKRWDFPNENVGYYSLYFYGDYFVKQYGNEVSISYYNSSLRSNIILELRTTYNAVDVPENIHFSGLEEQ